MLFVRSHFVWAELILVINFINLSWLYFRHNAYARFIHAPAVSGPLAWTFVAIYWNGAIMLPHQHNLFARVCGNIAIWSILAYGSFFLVAYKVRLTHAPPPRGIHADLDRTTPWDSPSPFSRPPLASPSSSARLLPCSGSLPLSSCPYSSS